MSPQLFRTVFNRRYRRLIDLVKFADVGVDVVHPLQPTAKGNQNPVRIKKEFGDRLAFYSNVVNTTIMPHGKPGDLVRRRSPPQNYGAGPVAGLGFFRRP